MGLLLAGMFGLSVAAVELSKEVHVGTQGELLGAKSETVMMASSDMYVGPDGELRKRSAAGGRHGDGDDGAVRVSSMPVILDAGGPPHTTMFAGMDFMKLKEFLHQMKRRGERGFKAQARTDDGEVMILDDLYLVQYTDPDAADGKLQAIGYCASCGMKDGYGYPRFYVVCDEEPQSPVACSGGSGFDFAAALKGWPFPAELTDVGS